MFFFRFFLFLVLFSNYADAKPEIRIAVAANFHHTLSKLLEQYPNANNINITLSSGSSGLLYAQIVKGAPFDMFFSADSERPKQLEKKGLSQLRATYARGKLVLWPTTMNSSIEETLANNNGRLAMAQPKLAPFGLAAQQTLQKVNLLASANKQLVFGNNVNQTFQFIDSGNAKLGFVSESVLLQVAQKQPAQSDKYLNYSVVPKHLYHPIVQQLVWLSRSGDKTEIKGVIDYLLSRAVQQQLSSMGYN